MPTEKWHITFDCKPLAVYCAVSHFQHFLEAHEFHIISYILTQSLNSKPDRHLSHQDCQVDFISQFTTNIRHVTGLGNPVTDALSCLKANSVQLDHTPPTVDFDALPKAQSYDADMQKLQSSTTTLKLQCPCAVTLSFVIHQLGTSHPYVPEQFYHIIFGSLHSISHPGVRVTQRMVTAHFV